MASEAAGWNHRGQLARFQGSSKRGDTLHTASVGQPQAGQQGRKHDMAGMSTEQENLRTVTKAAAAEDAAVPASVLCGTASGLSLRISSSTSSLVSPRNSWRPNVSSKTRQPRAQTSTAEVIMAAATSCWRAGVPPAAA